MLAVLFASLFAAEPTFIVVNKCPPAFVVKSVLPEKKVSISGLKKIHSHRCQACNVTWSHTDASYGNRTAHSCPNCGRVEWDIVVPTTNSCPGGVCPLPQKKGKRQ